MCCSVLFSCGEGVPGMHLGQSSLNLCLPKMLPAAKDAKPKAYALKVIDDPGHQRKVTCLLTVYWLRRLVTKVS